MAEFNGIYKVKNESGTYDVVNLKTTADQVVESTSRRFVSDSEKSSWNSKLTQATADGRYRQKTDMVFTDTISILTPAT